MSEEWKPNSDEFYMGQEGYVNYIGGLMIANMPDSVFARGLCQRELNPENEIEILTHAVNLMYNGCQSVIAFSNPESVRDGKNRDEKNKDMEHRFDDALPHMRSIINSTYSKDFERLNELIELNPSLSTVRPKPMIIKTVYHNLCHKRLGKLRVNHLMDGFLLAEFFNKEHENQPLTGLIGHGDNTLKKT